MPMKDNGDLPDAAPDLAVYREAVADLLLEIAGNTGPGDLVKAEKVVTERIADREFATVLSATPEGSDAAIQRLLREMRQYQPNVRSSAADLAAHIRIHLFALIDIMWWGQARAYVTDADLLGCAELVDLEPLRRSGQLRFCYRRQPRTLPARAARAADRRLRPARTPHTAGLRFTRTRHEAVILLNRLAADFATAATPGTPPLWVTSLARSVEHQRRLRALGYAASLPSAHCAGYAMDIEMTWFRQFGAHCALKELLLERQRAGEVNVIDEGQAWHMCISPQTAAALRATSPEVGG
ncbi:MAG TPA: DUF5715 family protein [Streptosporangiaceae bacterium]|nr:DUF5715 family protein [Streptosporangiaceae bacterium]